MIESIVVHSPYFMRSIKRGRDIVHTEFRYIAYFSSEAPSGG